MLKEVIEYFPTQIKNEIENYIKENNNLEDTIEEIRLRANKNLNIKTNEQTFLLKHKTNKQEIEETFENICEKSIYSYTKQIAEGFITIKGGNRVGLTGTCVIENEKVVNINNISSLNFRIAKQIKDVSTPILKYIIDLQNNTIFNTLIVSSPGGGKTTLIRDLVRKISTGIPEINFMPKICAIVDERSEIAAMYKGIPQNDIGTNTDVIDNVPKPIGINMLIRSMSPQIIVCDEIGSKEDIEAIENAVRSGVKGIFTAHAATKQEVLQNTNLRKIIENKSIQKVIILNEKIKGTAKEVLNFN